MTDPRLSVDPAGKSSISFHMSPASEEVIRIDAKGFHYRGQFIADAGEAHRLLVEFLRKHQPDTDRKHAMSEFSPAAQAVLDAYRNADIADAVTAAAVLRAVVDQMRYTGQLGLTGFGGYTQAQDQILAIADELEAQ